MRPTISSSQRTSAFWVNAFVTSDRSLPCTGSSMPSITPWPSTSPKIWITALDENVSLSRNICWMSSCRYTMKTGLPSSPGIADMSMRWIGVLVALFGQLRIGVADVARDDVVERPEVLEVVEQI